MTKPNSNKTKFTVISCSAPEARAVFVAGTFNDWNPQATPLKLSRDGKWSARLSLPPGQYQFKFNVDGAWCCAPGCEDDHACPNCVPNDHGTMNRILEVA